MAQNEDNWSGPTFHGLVVRSLNHVESALSRDFKSSTATAILF